MWYKRGLVVSCVVGVGCFCTCHLQATTYYIYNGLTIIENEQLVLHTKNRTLCLLKRAPISPTHESVIRLGISLRVSLLQADQILKLRDKKTVFKSVFMSR